MKKIPCKKCKGDMHSNGIALESILSGTPDFPDGDVVTVSPSGRAKIIQCYKCSKCGWSITR